MKKLLFFIVLLPLFAQAQINWPDCNTMQVTNVSLVGDSIKIAIYNNCDTCEAGINGPVYCEMRVVRTVAPYDTLGRSDCYCFWTPNNQSANTYTIKAEVNQLPGYADMQVVLYCGSGTCEVIPFAANVSVSEESAGHPIKIFPNPVKDYITIKGSSNNASVTITDATGRVVLVRPLHNAEERIDVTALPTGIYTVSAIECYQWLGWYKFVKE